MKALGSNGKLYTRDHPHEIISPHVMGFDEIREHLRELTTNPEYGWNVAGLERALGMNRGTLRDKLRAAWIWPKEQVRLTARIRDILDGRVVPRRLGRQIEGVVVDPPQPPRISLKPRVLNMHASVGPRGPQVLRAPPPKPSMQLPSFKDVFKNAPYWDPEAKRS